MKLYKRFYCRIFQKVMHLLIPFFPYREPVLLDGIKEIINVIDKENIKNVLLVTDKVIKELGLTSPLEELLQEYGINVYVYDKTLPNPTSDNVYEAKEMYITHNCDGIIAFGGGSPMDCAKAVGALIACPKKSLNKMAGLIKIRKKIPPLIAVPTTAGTGSETTVASVIVDSKTHHKYVINDFCLIPKYAVLEPKVTISLPKYITATTGMDALTHAVEAYIGGSKTKKSKSAAIKAVKLIFENLEKAFNNGEDIEARYNMLNASYLAGTAFTISYVGYVHAVAHTLGGKYGLPHGLANAVLLPHVLRLYGSSIYKSIGELSKAVGLVDACVSNNVATEAFISHIEDMNRRMNIPTKFDCIYINDIKELAKIADKEANPLYPVPLLLDNSELEKIYLLVYNNINN